ncbi:MAG: hypothetical protein Q9180_008146, partial [Flavoplaca navasiana]
CVFRSDTRVRCGTHTVTLYIAKMKNDHKKANANFAGSEDTGTVGAAVTTIGVAATPVSKATKRRTPKQKNSLVTPTTDNENDFAAGYGFDGETRTEDPTPF